MAAETDARCRGDVKKLALMFEELAASSPRDKTKVSEIINSKGCRGSSGSGTTLSEYSPLMNPMIGLNEWTDRTALPVYAHVMNSLGELIQLRVPVATAGEPAAYVDKRPSVTCNQCRNMHPPYSVCPYAPCRVCGKTHRNHQVECPYLFYLPKGASFPSSYEIICQCGHMFNEETWSCCTCSGAVPRLKPKYCDICGAQGDHCEYECTKDLDRAASYKAYRDECFARAAISREATTSSTFS